MPKKGDSKSNDSQSESVEPKRVEKVEAHVDEEANPRVGNTKPNEAPRESEGGLDTEDKPAHPFQYDAEPIFVSSGSTGRGSYTKEQREDMVKITPEQAYDDPAFNPIASAEPPGHRGGPGAPDGEGLERPERDEETGEATSGHEGVMEPTDPQTGEKK